MPILLAGDFNANVKDTYNAELVGFMTVTFQLYVLYVPSQGTTRYNSWTDMVFG
jgi:hypothetical protein